jgi:hypothetical protein
MKIEKYDKAKKMEESIKTYIENHHQIKEKFGEDTVLSEIEAFKVYKQTKTEKYKIRNNSWIVATL